MRRQARVEHPADLAARLQPARDRERVGLVPLHAHGERLGAAQHQEAVERRLAAAQRVLEEREAGAQVRIAADDGAADDVGVAVQVLRRRVDDQVGAEIERALEVTAS